MKASDSAEVNGASITLTKTALMATYGAAGQIIVCSLVAKNTGDVTRNNVSISDTKPGTLICAWPGTTDILKQGESVTCAGSYTITSTELNGAYSGTVLNTDTVTRKLPNGVTGPAATPSATVKWPQPNRRSMGIVSAISLPILIPASRGPGRRGAPRTDRGGATGLYESISRLKSIVKRTLRGEWR